MLENSSTLRAEDQQARAFALEEFAKPVVLIAGAGTGKTTALVRRLVVWALHQGWERHACDDMERTAGIVLQRIVCITFTDKAALEMAARVHQQLSALLEKPEQEWLKVSVGPATLQARARALLAAEGRLRVSTIHSFCSAVLRQHALTADIAPQFTLDAEGDERRLLAEDVFAELMPQLLAQPTGPLKVLLEDGIGIDELLDVVREFVQLGLHSHELSRLVVDERAGRDFAREVLVEAQALHDSIEVNSRGKKQQQKREEFIAVMGNVAEGVLAFDGVELRALAKANGFSDLADRPLKEIQDALTPAGLEELRRGARNLDKRAEELSKFNPKVLSAAREILRELLEAVEARMRLRGVMTFDQLLSQTRDLLVQQPQVAALLAADMDQLMVDEVQDTDPCQYEIVRALAFGSGPRPGLFVIGDPKQCIYTFRNADIAALEDFRAELQQHGAKEMRLSLNFRSTELVLAEVQALMQDTMHAIPGKQPPFEALLAARDERPVFAPGTHAIEVWDASIAASPTTASSSGQNATKLSARRMRLREAALVADDILAQHAQGTPWSECLVLLRGLTDQALWLDALRERGIPVQAENERNWHRRREVVDAANGLVAVLDPKDGVALLGWLRSPMVGLPDAAVEAFWRTPCRTMLAQGVLAASASELSPEAQRNIHEAVRAAEAAVEKARIDMRGFGRSLEVALQDLLILRWHFVHSDLATFFAEFRRRSGCQVTEARRGLGELRLAVLEELMASTEAQLAAGRSPARVVEDLRARLRADLATETTMPVDPQFDAVRVMTVHKAKGLEAAHVWLCDVSRKLPQGSVGFRKASLVRVIPARGSQPRRCAVDILGYRSLGLQDAEEFAKERERLEIVRLLYVAATRARHRLVVSGDFSPLTGGKGVSQQQPLLLNLSVRHDAAASSARAALSSGERSFMPEGNSAVLWRSLADVDLRPPRSTRTETARERPRILVANALPQEICNQAKKPVTLAASKLHSNEKPTEVVEDETEESNSLRRVAAERGTLIHKVFELWDSSQPAETEAQRLMELLQLAEPAGTDKVLGDARAEALEFVRRFSGMRLFQRLQAVAARIRAREFPVLMPGGNDASGALIGTIDMVYEEPEGSVVIVDYKSDKCDEATLRARHRSQLAIYVDALGAVLAPKPVRAELWSIHNDCVVPLD